MTEPLFTFRAYGSGDARQQKNVRIVYTEKDIQRALTAAYKHPTLLSVIRLGCDIILTKPVTVVPPAGFRGVIVDGGGQFRLVTGAPLTHVFSTSSTLETIGVYTVPLGGLTLQDLTIDVRHAVTDIVQVTTSFSSLVVRGLNVHVRGAVAKLFALPLVCSHVDIEGVTAQVYDLAVGSVTAAIGNHTGFTGANGLRCCNWRTQNLPSFTNLAAAFANCEFLGLRDDSVAMTFDARCDHSRLIDFYGLATIDLRSGGHNILHGIVCPSGGTPSPGLLTINATDAALGVVGYTVTAAAGGLVWSADSPTTAKLDDMAAPDDNTDLDVSTSKHGLMSKLPGGTTTFYRADGTFAAAAAAPSWTTVTKVTTETITSDAVLGDDAALVFSMAANTTYRIRASVAFATSANPPGAKFATVGPASPTRVHASYRSLDGAGASIATPEEVTSAYIASTNVLGTGPGAQVDITMIVENGANAGTFAIQWAQTTSSLTSLSVLKGSYLEYSVVA